jgi:phosphoserine phosphatase RsbU/P
LNEALLRQRGDYRFTTLAMCILDLSGDRPTLRAACGGHPRPLLLRPDGTAQVVGAMGPLLGVIPEAKFTDEHVELERDDLLVLYTDGLTDALAPQHMLDENDLLSVLTDCRGLSASEVSECLEARALASDPTGVPRDDIALVAAKLG